MLNDRITLFMLIKGGNKTTDITMRNIKKFVNLKTQLKKNLILSLCDFFFNVIVLKRI